MVTDEGFDVDAESEEVSKRFFSAHCFFLLRFFLLNERASSSVSELSISKVA